MNLDLIGGRKVVLGVLVMMIGVVVDAFAKQGLSGNLLELLKFVALGFFGGNAMEHVAGALRKPEVSIEPPEIDLSGLEVLQEQVAATNETLASTNKGVATVLQQQDTIAKLLMGKR